MSGSCGDLTLGFKNEKLVRLSLLRFPLLPRAMRTIRTIHAGMFDYLDNIAGRQIEPALARVQDKPTNSRVGDIAVKGLKNAQISSGAHSLSIGPNARYAVIIPNTYGLPGATGPRRRLWASSHLAVCAQFIDEIENERVRVVPFAAKAMRFQNLKTIGLSDLRRQECKNWLKFIWAPCLKLQEACIDVLRDADLDGATILNAHEVKKLFAGSHAALSLTDWVIA